MIGPFFMDKGNSVMSVTVVPPEKLCAGSQGVVTVVTHVQKLVDQKFVFEVSG